MKLTKAKRPHSYRKTNLYFNSENQAHSYVNKLKEESLLENAKRLEHPDVSKRKSKELLNLKLKKHLLTKEGSKYCLWESIK